MATDNSNPPISIKGLDVSDFFKDPSGAIEHLISGGVMSFDKWAFWDVILLFILACLKTIFGFDY